LSPQPLLTCRDQILFVALHAGIQSIKFQENIYNPAHHIVSLSFSEKSGSLFQKVIAFRPADPEQDQNSAFGQP
jgi:hypothetical protein